MLRVKKTNLLYQQKLYVTSRLGSTMLNELNNKNNTLTRLVCLCLFLFQSLVANAGSEVAPDKNEQK